MDHLQSYKRQVFTRLLLSGLFIFLSVTLLFVLAFGFFELEPLNSYLFITILSIVVIVTTSVVVVGRITQPLDMLAQIISFATHDGRSASAPQPEKLKIARELIHALSLQIYDVASESTVAQTSTNEGETVSGNQSASIYNLLPMPILGLDVNQQVMTVNDAAVLYIGKTREEMIGKPLFDSLNLSFQTDDNLETWLKNISTTKVTDIKTWERVRHTITPESHKQFDLIAGFSKDNISGVETTITMYDHTEKYGKDDQEISFVALAVHELRTPLTILRGYIEVFEDELGPALNPELSQFMHKMHASVQQLAAFVSNILNVARVEENQLSLRLRSEDWKQILESAVADLELRAQVHGKHIELQIPDDLPPIAADRISVHEVINNLVDNAIKYSDKSEKIVLSTKLNGEGLIETSVQDFGIGIPANVIGELFQKFHRSHKSKVQVGGTGLGLYLCRALVLAHGGNISARSKEGEGTTITFTLLPFDKVSSEGVDGEDGIIRGAHGWIKNHSLYRN